MSDDTELAEVEKETEAVEPDADSTVDERHDQEPEANELQERESSPAGDHTHLADALTLPEEARDALRDHLADCTPEMANAAIDIASRVAKAMPKPAPPSNMPMEHYKPGSGVQELSHETSWATAFNIR
ncbi:hypothetical protein ACLI1L_000283 [Corynebacterium sp. LaCa117]|uniref:hypothetical protein n=1 Tax=Corynebacterium sp. LaCa117 TaxID=3391424 RepID=UPI003989B5DF